MKGKIRIQKFLALIFLLVITACGDSSINSKEIEFNGLEKSSLKYSTNIRLSAGKGSEDSSQVLIEERTSSHQIDWAVNLKEPNKCELKILRLRVEIPKAKLFKCIFDTDLDTITFESKFGETDFSDENEKKWMIKQLELFKQIKGKTFIFVKDDDGKIKLEKTNLNLDNYKFVARFNPKEYLEQILSPDDILKFVNFVFYPEEGTFQKDKLYEIDKDENNSIKFNYTVNKENKQIDYWESTYFNNISQTVNTVIDLKNRQLIESSFYETEKKDMKDNPYSAMKRIKAKEIKIKQIK